MIRLRQGLLVLVVLAVTVSTTTSHASAVSPALTQQAPAPRAVPEALQVSITDAGFVPAHPVAVVGQSVEYRNDSSTTRTVAAADGTFDSGPIPPGGGFSVAVGAAGYHEVPWPDDPTRTGSLTVGLLDLPGSPLDLTRAGLPEIGVPPMLDADVHPELTFYASRTRILVAFADGATVGDANSAMAAAAVTLVATVPGINAAVVAVADPGPGDFGPVQAAIDVLAADPAVDAAGFDLVLQPAKVPPPAETGLSGGPPTDHTTWTWQDQRWSDTGGGRGIGGNWGIEASRFPQAWNLLDPVRSAGVDVQTAVVDEGFGAGGTTHPDVALPVTPVCVSPGRCTADTGDQRLAHGTHVAGIIGARYGNPKDGQPGRSFGIDGANPVADLTGIPVNGLPGYCGGPCADLKGRGWSSAAWTEAHQLMLQGKVDGRWPRLRVINMSTGELTWQTDANRQLSWGRLYAGKHCGPGDGDDATGTGPCTFTTHDGVRKAIGALGVLSRRTAENVSAANVSLVVAASNDNGAMCIVGDTVAQPPCAPGQLDATEDARVLQGYGWASAHWQLGFDRNPILLVGAVDELRNRGEFSNIGADVHAPGVQVLSTVSGGTYAVYDGTSMATPHVTALVGYLLAFRPSSTLADIRRLVTSYAQGGAGGQPAAIDAYGSLLAVPGAPEALLDVNDATPDGNRRVIRYGNGVETPDLDLGPILGGQQVHSTPDGHVDMRDFRRYRDAVLAACQRSQAGATPCTPATIALDGAADHPKRDGNEDGCVFASTAACDQPETAFSRFDFNGDGSLDATARARVPLTGTGPSPTGQTGDLVTDLELLGRFFALEDEEHREGWRDDQLDRLLTSGDLEIHAGALFDAGAASVEVQVTSPADQPAVPVRTIGERNGTLVVTAPVGAGGGEVSVQGIGRGPDGAEVARSLVETRTLGPGADARVDLCTPTVRAVPADPNLVADGADSTPVVITASNCGRPLGDGIDFELTLTHLDDGDPPAASLSAPSVTSDATGRAVVEVRSGSVREHLAIGVRALVQLDPSTPELESIDTTTPIEVIEPPHLIYRWEQVTTDWSARRVRTSTDDTGTVTSQVTTDFAPATDQPLVVSRSGTLTPVGDDDARLRETAGANTVPYRFDAVDTVTGATDQGTGALEIPPSQREHGDQLVSSLVTEYLAPDGAQRPVDQWLSGATRFDVDADRVVVHGFGDVAGNVYRYDQAGIDACPSFFCTPLESWDQLGLGEREQGSAVAYANDLTRPLELRRRSDGTFPTYRWCSAPQTFPMRGNTVFPFLLEESGQATSRFRFVATIVTDDTSPDSLELPVDCTEPKPPVAAIARDFVEAREGQVVQLLDASSDPNGDVVAYRWDFGDGTTSTEQFPEHRYADDGSYLVTLEVEDASGFTDRTSLGVDVVNVPPEVGGDPVSARSGEPVTVPLRLFDPGARDQEALTLRLAWVGEPGLPVYADRTLAGGAVSVALGVLPDGGHRLRATVTDKDGASAVATIDVQVGPFDEVVEPDVDGETEAAPGCSYGVKLDVGEQDAVDLVNAHRADNGRRRVYPSPTLTEAALAHARYLRDNDLFDHVGVAASTPAERAATAGYRGAAVGENLARGSRSAPTIVTAWKMSDSHDANMLDGAWAAIGIAKVDTTHGPVWVAVFGDDLDCPTVPPDFEADGAEPDPVVAPVGTPIVEVKAWRQSADPTPVVAVTVSDLTPATGQAVDVTNRSTTALDVAPGDGRPAQPLPTGASASLLYAGPGTFSLAAAGPSGSATATIQVTGAALPPVLAYTGPTSVPFGRRVTLGATLRTPTDLAIPGRTVTFAAGGRQWEAVTDGSGTAAVEAVVDLGAGTYPLSVDAPAVDGAPGASTTAVLTVEANGLPVVVTNGPYDVLVNDPLVVDLTGSYDPDGLPLQPAGWDLDGDGEYDDHTGADPVPAATVATVVCGGTCRSGDERTIAVRVADAAGAESTATETVRFRSDFSLSISPGGQIVNPGGSISYTVRVLSSSDFTDPVALSAPALPTGLTATFQPATVTPGGSAVLTVTASSATEAVDAPLVVRGTSGALVHDATGTIDVEFGLVPQCFGTVRLRVTDAETGAPLDSVVIYGVPSTGVDGWHTLPNQALGPGNTPFLRTYPVAAPGYWGTTTYVLAACGIEATGEVQLLRQRTGSVAGRVVVGIPDPNDHTPTRSVTPTDEPAVGTTVFLDPLSPVGPLTSAAFSFTGVPLNDGNRARPYTLTTRNPTDWSENVPVLVGADPAEPVTVAVVPQCFGQVDARVLDATTRRPVSGVDVTGFYQDPRSGGTLGQQGMTGADGRVRLDRIGLGPRNSAVTARVRAQATVAGRSVSVEGSARLEGCGSLGVVDLLLPTPVARRATLEGRVTDADTGAPVAGATIATQYSGPVRTDADGRYRIPDFVFGYDQQTSAFASVGITPPDDSWLPALGRSAVVTDGQTTVVDFTLTRRKLGDLEVRVVDAGTGDPVAGASVSVGGRGSVTPADGRVLVTGLPADGPAPTASASVSAFGFLSGSAQVVLRPGETVSVEVRLLRPCRPATITGLVRNAATGDPLPGATVTDGSLGALTGADGRYRLDGLALPTTLPRSATLVASKPGFLSATRTVSLYCGATITADIGVPDTGHASLSGTVTDAATGGPVAGATVGGEWGATAVTGADGRYQFADVPLDGAVAERRWAVDVLAPVGSGLADAHRAVTIRPDEAAVLDVALDGDVNRRPVATPLSLVVPLATTEVPLTLEAVDPDGDPLTYRLWGFTDCRVDWFGGPAVAFRFAGDGVTEGRFWFVATDGRADSAPVQVVIRREAAGANEPPVAAIAPVGPVDEGATVTLDGSGSSDPDGTVATYEWDLDGDGQFDDATGATTTLTRPDDANVTVGLRVTDDDGATATTTRAVQIRNVAPSVSAGGDATLGTSRLVRSGGFVDPGADTWTATVDWGEGGGPVPLALSGVAFELDHTFAASGSFVVAVEVCDDDGGCGRDSFRVEVPARPNTPPVASLTGPATVDEGSPAVFDAGASTDADGSVVAYDWDTDADGSFDDASGPVVAVPTVDDAVLTVAVRVTDDDGLTGVAAATVAVRNVAPGVEVGGDAAATTGTAFTRSGLVVDPGADEWRATVDWGDGRGPQAVAVGPDRVLALAHTFAASGSYVVAVEVCDDDGGCGRSGFTVDVTSLPGPAADLVLTKRHEGVLRPGGEAVYVLEVRNLGPEAVTPTLVDHLPAGLTFLGSPTASWTCGVSGPAVSCVPAGPMAAAAVAEVRLRVRVGEELPVGGTVHNEAVASSALPDPDPTDNTAADDAEVSPAPAADLGVRVDGPAEATAGTEVAWTITVASSGPDDAGPVTVTLEPPDGVTAVAANGAGWSCALAVAVTCGRGGLGAGQSAPLTLTGRVGDRAGPSADRELVVRVAGSVPDPDPADNVVVVVLAVVTPGPVEPPTTPPSSTPVPSPNPSASTSTTAVPTATDPTTARSATTDAQAATPAGTSSTATASGQLPATGWPSLPIAVVGLGLVGFGLVARRLAARVGRTTAPSDDPIARRSAGPS